MNKFKVGDEIRRKDGGNICNSATAVVTEVVSSNKFYMNRSEGHRRPAEYELVNPIKKKPTTKWQFQSRNPNDIDWEEIKKDVTRKCPLAVVRVGDKSWLIIHSSLARKRDTIYGAVHKGGALVQSCYTNNLSEYISQWKAIKQAK